MAMTQARMTAEAAARCSMVLCAGAHQSANVLGTSSDAVFDEQVCQASHLLVLAGLFRWILFAAGV